MSAPSFSDLGKSAADLFSKNFNFGIIKVEHKTSAFEDVSVTTTGTHSTESGGVNGSLEAKYKFIDYGTTMTNKWSTKNLLTTEICVEDKLLNGFKQTFEVAFNPNEGRKETKLKTSYKNRIVNSSLDFDLMRPKSLLSGSLVVRCPDEPYNKLPLGVNFAFDKTNHTISKLSFAGAYMSDDSVLYSSYSNGELVSSIWYAKSCCLQTGVNLTTKFSENKSVIGFATQWKPTSTSFVKAKIDTSCMVGLAYCREILNGVKMTLSGQFDAKQPNAGNHRLGFTVEFDK